MNRRRGVVLACLLALAASWPGPPPARAAEGLIVTSTAIYDVRPGEGRAVVTVDVAVTNVTPDSAAGRAASDADFDPLWSEWLLTDAQARELPGREEARAATAATADAIGDWQMPDSTRRHMEAWDFDDATAELARLDDLALDHAAMIERAETLSLEPSDEVRELLGTGIDQAADELGRQDEALEVLEASAERLAAERELIEEIGLIGEPDPADGLLAARAAFEAGDEEAARAEAEAATTLAGGAAAAGRLRVAAAGGAVLLADLLAMAALAVRRRQRRRRAQAASATA